jgi:aspartate aminotransferase-like enzyme
MHKKLFIPGPIEVREDVLARMAEPMIGHRGKEASALQRRVSDKLKTVFFTREEILLSTSSGSGLMEGAVRSCTQKRAAVFSIGSFGDRWFEMAQANGVPADLFSSDWGKPTDPQAVDDALKTGWYDLVTITHNETSTGVTQNLTELAEVIKRYPEVVYCVDAVSSLGGTPVHVDEAGIDICITSTQKALGLPPGMAICSFSEKAARRARQVKTRGFYLDLLKLYDYVRTKDYQYPSTPSLSHMFALDYQLDRILAEGLENRFARHRAMAARVRAWAEQYFALLAAAGYRSDTVTTVVNTRNINVAELNRALGERGYQISNGYGKMKDKTFRVAHMADYTLPEIDDLLEQIEDVLDLKA